MSNLVRLVDPDEIAAARRSARVNSAGDDAPLAEPADRHIVAGHELLLWVDLEGWFRALGTPGSCASVLGREYLLDCSAGQPP